MPRLDFSNVLMSITNNPNAIIILGMHRSGTSCLTGSLQQGGLNLGEHSEWNPYNLKGNRENQRVVELNDQILQASGGNWLIPPPVVHWTEEQKETAHGIINSFTSQPFGFKDPRTLINLDGWLALLPKPSFIGIFRHPRLVVQSLMARGNVTHEQGLTAWTAYNELLLLNWKKFRFPLLCFDWPAETFHKELNQIHKDLGLTQLDSNNRFFEPSLKNQGHNTQSKIPMRQLRLYWRLRLAALGI